MPEKTLIAANDIAQIELKLNPHSDKKDVISYHQFACKSAPEALKQRDPDAFSNNPQHALIHVWLKGSDKPITAGMAVLFDETNTTVELGSLFVPPIFRGFGFGQLLIDSLTTIFNDDHQVANYQDVKLTAKVRYGNYAPIPILNSTGFYVEKIDNHKVYWNYNPKLAHKTACRLYDKITAAGVVIEDDLFNALCSVHGSVRVG